MKNNNIGRSMVEMLGVLAIIGVLSAGALAGYSRAMAKHKINRTMQQMVTIVNNVRTVFYNSQNPEYPYEVFKKEASAMKKAVALNVFPEEMIVDRNIPTIQNLYKGDVKIVTNDAGKSFEVVFDQLPKEASIAIGTIDWGIDDVTGLQEVLINEGDEASEGSEGGEGGE
ncbi:MAG: hypothetical protein IJ870_00560 [Alphaproteobacteria bacterium]|nr:hypothetical protein [Alphaproteobacteria bacterium]